MRRNGQPTEEQFRTAVDWIVAKAASEGRIHSSRIRYREAIEADLTRCPARVFETLEQRQKANQDEETRKTPPAHDMPPYDARDGGFWTGEVDYNGKAIAREPKHPISLGCSQEQHRANLEERQHLDLFEWINLRKPKLARRIERYMAKRGNEGEQAIADLIASIRKRMETHCPAFAVHGELAWRLDPIQDELRRRFVGAFSGAGEEPCLTRTS